MPSRPVADEATRASTDADASAHAKRGRDVVARPPCRSAGRRGSEVLEASVH